MRKRTYIHKGAKGPLSGHMMWRTRNAGERYGQGHYGVHIGCGCHTTLCVHVLNEAKTHALVAITKY